MRDRSASQTAPFVQDVFEPTLRPQPADAALERALECVCDQRQLVERAAQQHDLKRHRLARGDTPRA
jgi:hypothetical protein